MIKKNIGKLIISSVIILVPIAAGLILWDKLPGTMAAHWNAQGETDGYAGKGVMIFLLPLIFLAVQWLCIIATAADPKNKDQSKKAINMVIWILPVLSVVISSMIYSIALGAEFNIAAVMIVIIGLSFVLIGNYIPKCKVNHTIGIRVPWTINDEEIWNKTHRFASRLWVVGGILIMLVALLPVNWAMGVMIAGILLLGIVPTVYSYVLFKKKGGKQSCAKEKKKTPSMIISIILLIIILAAVVVLMFTGDVEVICKEESFDIKATYWSDIEVSYDRIDSIEYRDSFDGGTRTNGFGGPTVLYGTFQNDEFGYYTRYTYTKNNGFIILDVEGKKLVLGLEDKEATQMLYKELLDRIG